MYRPTAASSSRQGQGWWGDRPAVVARRDVPGQGGQQLGGDRAEQPFDLPPAAGFSGCAVDQLHLEVGAHLGDVGAGEVGAVVAVQHRRHPAHRPGRVGLAPDRLPQRQRGLQRLIGSPRNTVYPATAREWSSRITVNHGRAGRPVSSSTMTSSSVWSACHMSFGCADSRRRTSSNSSRYTSGPWCAIASRPRSKPGDDPSHHRVGRRRPALLGGDPADRPVDLGDPGRRPPQRHPLDQLDHLRWQPPTTPVGPIQAAQAVKAVRLVRRQPPGRGPAWYPGPTGGLRQRDPVVQMRIQHRQPTVQLRHQHTRLRPNQPPTSSRPERPGIPRRAEGEPNTSTKVSHLPRPTTVLGAGNGRARAAKSATDSVDPGRRQACSCRKHNPEQCNSLSQPGTAQRPTGSSGRKGCRGGSAS